MDEQRPNPDALLARVKADEARAHRGHLKIFFGMAPGVGKTYTMLEAAQARRVEGVDVVVGVVETHKRAETAALTTGLELLPAREQLYQGRKLREFDIDVALKRRPALILMDELAHSNVEGSRHAKRWQDVEELLDAGIDVYTTVNVQHLESVNDIVGSITGIRVQETVPDRIFEQADEVELIDLPPDELLQRLEEGKVYLPEQAERAAQHFFRKGNLIALRELSLRRTADRVDAQMRDYRDRNAIGKIWAAADRLLVAIGPTADADSLVRAGKRMATALNCEWLVAYVETPGLQRASKTTRERLLRTLELAESLGAETVALAGPLISAEILGCAQARNITKLLIGKPATAGWKRLLFGSVVETIIKEARQIDVFVIGSEPDASTPERASKQFLARSESYDSIVTIEDKKRNTRRRVLSAVAVIGACTAIAWPLHSRLDNAVLVMIYLLGVVLAAVRYGQLPSVVAAVLAVASFDFFFVPPYLTFAVADTQYLLTFVAMLTVALVISRLASGLRLQARIAGFRERRVSELYAMSREMADIRAIDDIRLCAMRHINAVFGGLSIVLLPDDDGRIRYPQTLPAPKLFVPEQDMAAAQWVFDRGQSAGHSTDTLPAAEALFLPLQGSAKTIGVLAIRLNNWNRLRDPEQRRQLDTFASQVALALERLSLATQAESARMANEAERLRNSLLAAISHDLRTPLATLIGSASVLARTEQMSDDTRRELALHIGDEAERMAELIAKVLDMARLEAGNIALRPEWSTLEEVIGASLNSLKERLRQHTIVTEIPADLGLVMLDPILIERVFANLIENAVKYTPAGSTIRIRAKRGPDEVAVQIADNGPGLPAGSEQRVFDKFYRANPESASPGVGLGLAICRAIIEAHHGRIWAESAVDGGAAFVFVLPQTVPAPVIEHDGALL
ncbi:sensor histidine kinase KdpD [Permianibacter sp. IMCC34836]|nr:sensor histidine kinase KdpD [Permianibacter fluminis]